LGRYWNALITRWWLPLAGLVAGIAIGYLLSLGGHQIYTAKATIYLGQPLNPTGTGQIQSLSTNPSTVKQVVLSPYWQHVAERQAQVAAGGGPERWAPDGRTPALREPNRTRRPRAAPGDHRPDAKRTAAHTRPNR